MKTDYLESVQVSERVTIRAGDQIRARGGPTLQSRRIGHPGTYVVQYLFRKRLRFYAVAMRVDKASGVAAGTYTLFVKGKPHVSTLVPTIIERPYKISKPKRSTTACLPH